MKPNIAAMEQKTTPLLAKQCARMRERGVSLAAKHSRNFLNPRFPFHASDLRERAVPREFLGNNELPVCVCGDLWQMRDTDYLMCFRQRFHHRPDRPGDFAAHIDVNLVED